MKKVFNVFGIILAIVFSLILVISLMFVPLFHGASHLLQPEVVEELAVQLVEEIDLSELASAQPELVQSLTEAGISEEAAQALLSSKAGKEILALLGRDLAQVVHGSYTTTSLTAEELSRIVADNRGEITEIARLLDPENTQGLSDDQVGQLIDMLLAEQVTPLLAELDTKLLELQAEFRDAAGELLYLANLAPAILLGITLVLAVLIFLCRWPHQEGLMWLGIDFILAVLPSLGAAFSLKSVQISQLLAQETGLPNVFDPVLRKFGNTLLIDGLLIVAVAVVLIAIFILLRDRRLKKAAVHANDAPQAHPDYKPADSMPIEPVTADSPARERSPWDNM